MTVQFQVLGSVLPPLLMLAGLAYFVITDKYILKIHRRTMLVTIVLIATMIIHNLLDYYFVQIISAPVLRRINCAYGYIVYPVVIIMIYYFVDAGRKYWPAWCLAAVNTAVYVISLFVPIAFKIREDNVFVREPLGYTSHIICFLLLLGLFFLTIRRYGARRDSVVIPVMCLLLIVGAMILDVKRPEDEPLFLSFLVQASVICCVLFYLWIRTQIIKEYEKDILAQQRMRIMVSQIQPHFLYNTIATISALCKTDPDKAVMVAEKFSFYLRRNLDSLSDENLISVEKELEHTRAYAEIEMVRFENIRIEYDIRDTGFLLPALTIQPIVENAIRHGVRAREEGVVRVCTCLSGSFHEIVISDNGVGFDQSDMSSDNRTHIGIRNVRERIEKMCGGTLEIVSEPDHGTTVTILIPRRGGKKRDDSDLC